ncbi:MAG TPA: hypothetical protein VNT52_08485 [Acidimicrobiales bacterium]|nr:hypothetical protein [Acidimicrobiales bacterium]
MNRYGPVERAVAGSILVNIVVQLAVFLPGVSDDVPSDAKVVSVLTATIAAAGAWGLWNRRTWGRRTTLVLTILNVLSTVPYLFEADSGEVTALAATTVALGVMLVALLLSSDLKREVGRPVATGSPSPSF